MFNKKILISTLLALVVLLAQVGVVAAAPPAQDSTTTTITGTIQSITFDPETETVLVTVLLEDQVTTQTVNLSTQEAFDHGLFDLDTQTLLAQPEDSVVLVVDPNDIVPAEEPAEPDVHPISALLATFFFPDDPEMASVIDSYHTGDNDAEHVFGFGVIAQALWMSESLSEDGTVDADLAGLILNAKQSGDYSAFELPDGSSPTNWGQFKKAILQKDKKNLGLIVSGHAEDDSEDSAIQEDHGNGKDKNKDKGKGKGKDKNKNHP